MLCMNKALLGAHITEAKVDHVLINGKQHHVPFIGFKTETGLQVTPLHHAMLAPCGGCHACTCADRASAATLWRASWQAT